MVSQKRFFVVRLLFSSFLAVSLFQKFAFCGDLDAPDWLLQEITVLSKMVCVHCFTLLDVSVCFIAISWIQSSVRVKLLCRQVLEQLYGREINVCSGSSFFMFQLIVSSFQHEKVRKLTRGKRLSFGIFFHCCLSDFSLESCVCFCVLLCSSDLNDVKAILSTLHFILRSSSKYDVDEKTLHNELLQLGLPKGNILMILCLCLLNCCSTFSFLSAELMLIVPFLFFVCLMLRCVFLLLYHLCLSFRYLLSALSCLPCTQRQTQRNTGGTEDEMYVCWNVLSLSVSVCIW